MAELEILVKVWVILLGILTLSDVQANRLKTLTVSGSLKEKYGMPSAREINVEQKSDGLNTVFSSYKSLHHQKREVGENSNITTKITRINDTHQQLMVHWVGVGSDVIICLAKSPRSNVPSSLYISYDYGDTFENKTEFFILSDSKKSYASLDKFYNHPTYINHLVFADVKNGVIFTTTDSGKTFNRIKLNFSPSDISFQVDEPFTFLAHDKIKPSRELWLTTDFGQSWKLIQQSVKTFHWSGSSTPLISSTVPNVIPMKGYPYENDSGLLLFVERVEPSGKSTILSMVAGTNRVWMTDVNDFKVIGDFMFAIKTVDKNNLDLYVSYKRGPFIKAIFPSELNRLDYHILDVSEGQIFVAVSHTDTLSNLYTSQTMSDKNIFFALSLERILCFFPNSTWKDSWLTDVTEESFADFHKVEGLRGIYIVSQVQKTVDSSNIGPEHLLTLITFDRGGEWRPLTPPPIDDDGLPIKCNVSEGCSLHLSQKFNELYPSTRSAPILSSESAPGIIMATGTIGKSLKGHPKVFLSRDGGLTWRQILKDYYFFNFGDHGGVLVAVKFYKSSAETRELLYSTDEGEKFLGHEFHTEDLRIYGLMTEPGGNTTVFTMFGSALGHHQWLIIKVDLRNAFSYNCTPDDYKFWSPSSKSGPKMPCILGKKETFERRIAHSNCYNGRNYSRPIKMEICECDIEDFECDFGFERSMSTHHCIRNKTSELNPYKVPSTCRPGAFYNRTKGYRKIPGDVCVDGYETNYLPTTLPCPLEKKKEFLLIPQKNKISRIDLKDFSEESLPILNLESVTAIEYDLRNNCVYWADIHYNIIGRHCFDNDTSSMEVIVEKNLGGVEGMALDWVSKNLYFVDGIKRKIEVIRTDINNLGRMRRTILGDKDLKQPRGVAVHPMAGYLYWTDWATDEPSVSRANLNGSDIRRLFRKPVVEWPNGITIDFIAERVYWVDAKQNYIASADLDGKRFKKIITNDERVSHPFAVAVFKDFVYWEDWGQKSIFVADKDHGTGIQLVVKNIQKTLDLKVFAHSFQEGTNLCGNITTNNCSHLCFGGPGNTYSCLCPQDMELVDGNCSCLGNKPPEDSGACPPIEITCPMNYFTCSNKKCIPDSWRCNKHDDCQDGSDELNCSIVSCPSNMFTCSPEMCIPETWVCDHEKDCDNGADEANCTQVPCKVNEFRCKNNLCVDIRYKCDFDNDCHDNSDEENCFNQTGSCKPREYKCESTCISESWRCDGDQDCPNNEDEMNCSENVCKSWQFQCANHKCILGKWECDGQDDCGDNSDEQDCQHESKNTTSTMHSLSNVCNDWTFKCNNGSCIPLWWKCDSVSDCKDSSDEVGCDEFPIEPNTDTHIKCDINQFKCLKGEECIEKSLVCDGVVNCPDGSDEHCEDKHLPTPANPSCHPGLFPCDGALCIPLAAVCDGHQDCYDGMDETNCNNFKRQYQVDEMSVDQKSINSSSFLLHWQIRTPEKIQLEFLPSIAEGNDNVSKEWKNMTWLEKLEYRFVNLKPYTTYTMTVYVKLKNTNEVFPPAKFVTSTTLAGVPSPPRNVSVIQKSYMSVEVSWLPPETPNGPITSYAVGIISPAPLILKSVPGWTTELTMKFDFVKNEEYSFWVTAKNDNLESNLSNYATLKFDPLAYVEPVEKLIVVNKTENSITLSWKPVNNVDGYRIKPSIPFELFYPKLPVVNVSNNTTFVTIGNLAPNQSYKFQVSAFRKHLVGPPLSIEAQTQGIQLPVITGLTGKLIYEEGTSVHLSWKAPEYPIKKKWVYGVYYAVRMSDLFEGTPITVTNLTAIVSNLQACESFLFVVGLVGPMGTGPFSSPIVINTFNRNAPPKRLTVKPTPKDENYMILQWESSCKITPEAIGYEVVVTEINLNKSSSLTLLPTKQSILQHEFQTHYGGRYSIFVSTTSNESIPSSPVYYDAPEILPPHSVQVLTETNGSFTITWSENEVPDTLQHSSYRYRVFVSEGEPLNISATQHFDTESRHFIFNDVKEGVNYSFAVQLLTEDGYSSRISEINSVSVPLRSLNSRFFSPVIFSTTLRVFFLFIMVGGILAFLVDRHKRLKRNFSSYANSHYDTRSGSTTFGGAEGLDDEDSPNIRGFSDDEPLVMA